MPREGILLNLSTGEQGNFFVEKSKEISREEFDAIVEHWNRGIENQEGHF